MAGDVLNARLTAGSAARRAATKINGTADSSDGQSTW
jgi:hypothetical protein